jgi:hypothetical protein
MSPRCASRRRLPKPKSALPARQLLGRAAVLITTGGAPRVAVVHYAAAPSAA